VTTVAGKAAARAEERGTGGSGTLRQRAGAGVLAAVSWLACRLPERPLVALAEAAGELWYRLAPGRAAMGRQNLARVVAWLAAEGMGPAYARRAATDRRALERLVRAAFRHQARYYLEVARAPVLTPDYLRRRLVVETPEVVETAFADGTPTIFVSGHFGAIEMPGLYLADRTGRTPVAPMETIDDPALQRYFVRTRGALGVRIVGLREARRELLAAIRRGDPVGLVADRDIGGGGMPVRLFGAEARLPVGPALLAVETGASMYLAAVRRTGVGSYAGRLLAVPVPADGSWRERIAGALAAEAQAFERVIADAPEQWWAVFFPIWQDAEADRSSGADDGLTSGPEGAG
jgi:phosphatidylinositol dimannoside acyltransferase